MLHIQLHFPLGIIAVGLADLCRLDESVEMALSLVANFLDLPLSLAVNLDLFVLLKHLCEIRSILIGNIEL